MIIDTHAHLNFKAFDRDREEVIKRTLQGGVLAINVGAGKETSKKAVEISCKYPEMYSSVGLHPIHVDDEDFSKEEFKKLIKKGVVAIGETGLDKERGDSIKQRKVFLDHISLAREENLPLIFHCRKAHKEMIDILKKEEGIKGVMHCFTGKMKEAKEYLDMGLFLGFNGIIFKMNLKKVIEKVPLDKILVETDCPFLSPFKDKERNEPLFIEEIIKEIAKIKGIKEEEVKTKTSQNARNLFGIKKDPVISGSD